MQQAISSTKSNLAEAGDGRRSLGVASSRMTYSRIIGALFLSGFLVYGVGSALATSATGAPHFLASIVAHPVVLIIGASLMLLNTVVDLGKGVLFFPILGRHSRRTALGYLATMVVEVTLLDVGAIALLMIVPLSGQHGLDAAAAAARGSALVHTNAMFYQFGEMTLAAGCVALCALLFRTRLIPRFLAISGLIGYPILMVGAIAEVIGIHVGLLLTIPGMFFELVLPFWLFTKGFQSEAYLGRASRSANPTPVA
ncbi:MAG TPA: DUF4386 domain-containing protein [Candidatus Dormibacteraeota bacterium]